MAYTVSKLITGSYNLSGIVSKDFEQISGPQLSTGLDLLNDILGDKTSNNGMIPYYTKYNFTAVPNQEEYFIPNLIDIETFTFFINSIRYATLKNERQNYFGSPRAENIQSLPFNWHMERAFIPGAGPAGTVGAGAKLFLYFKPDIAYPMEIWGSFGLSEAAFNDDMALIYDRFYINYLKYELAQRICDEYSYVVPPNISERLESMALEIDKNSGKMDLTQNIVSSIGETDGGLNYGQVNIGHGWTV